MKADPAYGKGVAAALSIPLNDLQAALTASGKTLQTADLKIPLDEIE